MTNRYEINMCEGSMFGKILRFALPLMLSSVLQRFFNVADTVVVSRFAADGNTALAAVGSAGPLISLIINLFIGLSTGVTVRISRAYGARNKDTVDRCVHTAILLAMVCGVFVGCLGFFGAETFLTWMGTPKNVLGDAALYVRLYFLGMPAMMLYNFGASSLRAVGDTKRPLVYLTAAGIVNVFCNLVFVIVFHLDVAGVAIATVISQCISAALVIRCLAVSGGSVQLYVRRLRIDKTELWQIVRVGVPAGMQGTAFSLSNVLTQSAINGLDTAMFAAGKTSAEGIVMAGNTAASNIEDFVYLAMNSFCQSCMNFVSQNLGACKIDRVRRSIFLNLVTVSAVGLVLGVGGNLFGESLLEIFRPGETEVIAIGIIRLRYHLLPYFLCGVMEVLAGAMRGLGKSLMPTAVALMGACVFRIGWLYTVFAWMPRLEILYISYPLSWILTAAVHAICIFFTYRKVKRSLPSVE